MSLKDRIIDCLNDKSVKKTDLATAIKSPRTTVTDWTLGKTKNLSGEKLILASEFFGVNPKWLSTGKGQKYQNDEIKDDNENREYNRLALKNTNQQNTIIKKVPLIS